MLAAMLSLQTITSRAVPDMGVCWQAVLLVIDSTDRERLMTIKEELYSMLAHEVSRLTK